MCPCVFTHVYMYVSVCVCVVCCAALANITNQEKRLEAQCSIGIQKFKKCNSVNPRVPTMIGGGKEGCKKERKKERKKKKQKIYVSDWH